MVHLKIRYIALTLIVFSIYSIYNNRSKLSETLTDKSVVAAGQNNPAEVLRYDKEWLSLLPSPTNVSPEIKCMAEAIYFEARGERIIGQLAVGQVILNRVESIKFPNDICSVVYQGKEKLNRCQFSYACDGKPEIIQDAPTYKKIVKLANYLVSGNSVSIVGKSLYYHASSVKPYWADNLKLHNIIGNHYFYENN